MADATETHESAPSPHQAALRRTRQSFRAAILGRNKRATLSLPCMHTDASSTLAAKVADAVDMAIATALAEFAEGIRR